MKKDVSALGGSKTFVLSLGGSLINPGQVDAKFLKQFKNLVVKQTGKGNKFILITGGGKLSRNYQEALKQVTKPTNEDLDWMGISATWVNADLVRLIFGKLAHGVIVKNPNNKVPFKEAVLVAGGWEPGRSTDDDAVRLAKAYGAKAIINLSNIDYVYDKDPRKFKDAKPIKDITWKDFKKIVGSKWDPGKNAPFDPTAAKTAEKDRMTVIIANGKNLKNLERILSGKPFVGTVIS